ncbi:hypothetical protein FRB91_011619 [Serendipita sp. 411]|nr:hypothetical protein FRC18_009569 [Serendipita sp. 400]KAG8860990.1 hypothetical protein FRB91_011619 [Serendipita sp. 411]
MICLYRILVAIQGYSRHLQLQVGGLRLNTILGAVHIMSCYVYELPTTGNISFSEILLDQTGQYTHAIANATAARSSLRAALKESKRTEDGERDHLKIIKIIDDYLPHLYGIIECVDADDLQTRTHPVFSWRTTLSANILNTSPRQSVTGLFSDLAFTLLTYGSALCNLAASSVTSLGQYERERAITDAQRKVKDEKLNFSVQLFLKAAGVFSHVAESVIPQWERALEESNVKADPLMGLRPVEFNRELVLALSRFSMAEAQTLAIRKLLTKSAYDSTLTPGPPLPKSHPSPKLIAKLSLNALENYSSALSLAKGARGGLQGNTEVTKDITRWLGDETTLASALSHKWLGVDAGEQSSTPGKAGESIGFLQWAKTELEDLKDGGHGISGLRRKEKRRERVSEEIESTSSFLSHYKKLNNTLHFEPIPPIATLQSLIPTGTPAVTLKPFTPPSPAFRPSSSTTGLSVKPQVNGEGDNSREVDHIVQGDSTAPNSGSTRSVYF